MGKLRYILLAAAVSATVSGSAAWRVVIDPSCIKAVAANLASQKLIEDQHNKRLDSIAARKQKVELYTVSMAPSRSCTGCRWRTSPASARRASITMK